MDVLRSLPVLWSRYVLLKTFAMPSYLCCSSDLVNRRDVPASGGSLRLRFGSGHAINPQSGCCRPGFAARCGVAVRVQTVRNGAKRLAAVSHFDNRWKQETVSLSRGLSAHLGSCLGAILRARLPAYLASIPNSDSLTFASLSMSLCFTFFSSDGRRTAKWLPPSVVGQFAGGWSGCRAWYTRDWSDCRSHLRAA